MSRATTKRPSKNAIGAALEALHSAPSCDFDVHVTLDADHLTTLALAELIDKGLGGTELASEAESMAAEEAKEVRL